MQHLLATNLGSIGVHKQKRLDEIAQLQHEQVELEASYNRIIAETSREVSYDIKR